jgi:pyruvate-formate lyase-activating enzyme
MNRNEQRYHVIVLSNFARGFDKYSHSYAKAGIPESHYPDRFFLLRREELDIGIGKASRLLGKLAIPGNRLLVLATDVDPAMLHPNEATGLGQFVAADRIVLSQVHELEQDGAGGTLRPTTVEDAMAASLALQRERWHDFAAIRPRTISFLPIAAACQARCAFCFSKASISSDQAQVRLDWDKVGTWLDRAAAAGAARAVITGGGEPTLLPPAQLQQLVGACAQRFDKVVLISNGHVLAKAAEEDRVARLDALHGAGLGVLAISRHHHDAVVNERLMGLHTPVERLADTLRRRRDRWPGLRLRLICVLQQGGVQDEAGIAAYLDWAAGLGVEEICFKELYVSTSTESLYYERAANAWSRSRQVPLALLTRFCETQGFTLESRLPWGAPVYRGSRQGRPLRVAAYTEPSLFWERTQGIARSWNIMADGRCHVSLEDRASELALEAAA